MSTFYVKDHWMVVAIPVTIGALWHTGCCSHWGMGPNVKRYPLAIERQNAVQCWYEMKELAINDSVIITDLITHYDLHLQDYEAGDRTGVYVVFTVPDKGTFVEHSSRFVQSCTLTQDPE